MRWLGIIVLLCLACERTTPMPPKTPAKTSNRLIHEKSPYLLQHAYNPVDWYPWGEEAFAKATREDKPVLVSIGYSTCYWCHVMEQESFENPEVAALMNETVVAIKVDREERPDLDAIYMSAVMAMTGSGGWPMNVFLTPEGKPFWGGTYFPPDEWHGRPGFKDVLRSIAQAWRTRREELLRSSDALTQALQGGAAARAPAALTLELLATAAESFAHQHDTTFGGFGSAPKFPQSHALSFLLRSWFRTRNAQTLAIVEGTLEAMARGGIHDQLGGGFHRYSTDERWLVPHFEKMLYDQALLARTYVEAHQATGKPSYAEVARGIFTYVLRDLRDANGAFYSAEDAGEVGKEGEFYVWTPEEMSRVLGPDAAARVSQFYGVTKEGNFEHGATILHLAAPEARPADLDAARAKLLAARSQRARPHRDDKILTDWNGLMIGALAYGARALDEPRYAQAAREAADFILTRLQYDGHLLHRYRDGEAAIPAFLEDYAFLIWGLLDLYETTHEARWLAEAKRLTQEMLRLFWDEQGGGFFLSGQRNERLIASTKEVYDGATPSGNSVAALALVRLGLLTMDKELQSYAQRLFQAFSGQASQLPVAFPQFLGALDMSLGPSQEIVIAGDPAAEGTRKMLRAVQSRFLPRAVLILHPADAKDAAAIEALTPFVKAQQPLEGKPTAYVCENHVCRLPTTDPAQLTTLLERF